MSEKSLWSYIRNGMKGKWTHANRHEDSVSIGIADVSYYHRGNSWIELKEVKKLPVRRNTPVRLGQWHKNGGAQRHFLTQRKGWLLIRVNHPKRMYLLFDHNHLPPWISPLWNWIDMTDNAQHIWTNKIDFVNLAMLLGDPE